MATIKPLADKVLVKPSQSGEMTKGGIALPESAKERPQEGTVVSVGPGRTLDSGEKNVGFSERGRCRHLLEIRRPPKSKKTASSI